MSRIPKVKLRKLGYSKGVTVPKEITPVAEKYRVYQNSDGMILYVPVSIDNSSLRRPVPHNPGEPAKLQGPDRRPLWS